MLSERACGGKCGRDLGGPHARGSVIKNLSANAGDIGSIPQSGRCPGEGHVFLSGKYHGQRSLEGYSPWGRKESDTNEKLSPQACVGLPRTV